MRALTCAAVVVACSLVLSGCASSHAAHDQSSTDAIQLHESGYNRLSLKLQNFVNSLIKDSPDGRVTEIDVYGPGTRAALVKASSGDIVYPTGSEATAAFYLIVSHGHFVCQACSGPAGHKAPQGTIETRVWSPSEKTGDFGIQNSLPPAVSRLHRLATITLS